MKSLIGFLFSTVRLSVRSLIALVLVVSIFLNVVVLTVSGVHAAFSGALSAVGFTTVAAREAAEKLAIKKSSREITEKAARETTKRATMAAENAAREAAERVARKKATTKIAREITDGVTARVQRQAVRNSASVFGESIPFSGVAVIAGALALEVKDSCDTAKDIASLTAALEAEGDPDIARETAEEAFDCRDLLGDAIDVPTKDEIWAVVRSSPQLAWDSAASAIDSVQEIDWAASWSASIESAISFGDWVVSNFDSEDS